ncbi:hypothetical protein [Micromonospora sp. RP3T]|uniref:hypothetical protein n=1 Tax=Micromonospora sp. RP3T TaxID=2135446 RepID=UPI000D172E05|nr:hypothetical protein [Micromonospora sp. RP3T]PTA43267.1 hypothetical protein C8054_26180 [Micromonospora sp. RP3T]
MGSERVTLVAVCAEEAAQPLVDTLTARGVAAQASGRRNLDGAAVTSWMVVAGVALKMAPDILRALAELVREFRVGRVEMNLAERTFAVDNPGPADIEELLRQFRAATELPAGDDAADRPPDA